jgi:regulator of sigma E protease
MFGFLIVAHEFGHFISARMCGVRVNEFAIGMGPVIYKKHGKETDFSLRIFPIGGFCAMEGEDSGSEDPRAFNRKSPPKRFLILAAGSIMNFLVGFIILIILASQMGLIATNKLSSINEGVDNAVRSVLQPGDEILKINGNNIYTYNDIPLFLSRYAGEPYDITVKRDGKTMLLKDVPLEKKAFTDNGVTQMRYGLEFKIDKISPLNVISQAWLNSVDYVRLVRISLIDLISGNAAADQIMGAVGIVDYMNTVTRQAKSLLERIAYFLDFAALVAINLAVMNLLPLPALDGGRIIFVLIELIRRKPVDIKYEALVHAIGFAALILLMVYVSYNDVLRIISRAAGG